MHGAEHEGFLVLDGEIAFNVDGQSVTASPGSFAQLPPGVPHAFKNATAQTTRMLILVAPGGMEEMFERTGQPVVDRHSPIPPPRKEEIETLLKIAPEYQIEILIDGH